MSYPKYPFQTVYLPPHFSTILQATWPAWRIRATIPETWRYLKRKWIVNPGWVEQEMSTPTSLTQT